MAKNTEISLRNKVIYSVYVRNHTNDGTFNAVAEDLDRIKSLGTDIIWFMPIHPIGVKNKKGSLGCPYANKDYRTTNPEYGTMDDFKSLVEKIHAKGMKCIIDVVYNHTSPDSNLSVEHPEFFYRKPDGNFGNKVGDWSDIIDLDYSNKELWQYQIDSLVMWAKIVDGFRCDVASFVPVEFWKQARENIAPFAAVLVHFLRHGLALAVNGTGKHIAQQLPAVVSQFAAGKHSLRQTDHRLVKGGDPHLRHHRLHIFHIHLRLCRSSRRSLLIRIVLRVRSTHGRLYILHTDRRLL